MGNIYPKVRKGPKNRLDDTEIKEGQMLTTTDTKEVFVDIDQTRVQLMTSGGFTEVNNVGKLLGWDGEKLVLLDSSEFVSKSVLEKYPRCIASSWNPDTTTQITIGKGGLISIITGKVYTDENDVEIIYSVLGTTMDMKYAFVVYVASQYNSQQKLYMIVYNGSKPRILTLASYNSSSDGTYNFSLKVTDLFSRSPYIKVNKTSTIDYVTWLVPIK